VLAEEKQNMPNSEILPKVDLSAADKRVYQITPFQNDEPCFALRLESLKTAHKKDTMNTEKLVVKKQVNGKKLNGFTIDDIGDDHLYTGLETPMKPDAFKMSDAEKKERISILFREIMDVMGLDLTDDSLQGTPDRVAKMYIDEIFSGLNPKNKPKVALFDNKYQYNQMLVEKNITFYSNCEHHFVPIIGKAHVAYISSGKVIGLSKLNRIVQYYAKRPQVQERLTNQIGVDLQEILGTDSVAVIIDAKHLCVSSRGIKDDTSATVTTFYGGEFNNPEKIRELQSYLND
jgi:GTP cyclohydrolase I